MNCEMAHAIIHGEMPPDFYRVPSTVDTLVETIETINDGGTVVDAANGECVTFGRTVGGKWVFVTAEFLDDDERTRNPDFHICHFDTVREGVERFTINGTRLLQWGIGRKFWASDCGCLFPDEPPLTAQGGK